MDRGKEDKGCTRQKHTNGKRHVLALFAFTPVPGSTLDLVVKSIGSLRHDLEDGILPCSFWLVITVVVLAVCATAYFAITERTVMKAFTIELETLGVPTLA